MKLKLNGRFLVGGINVEENEIVEDVTRNMVRPKNILMTLKDKRKRQYNGNKASLQHTPKVQKSIRIEMSEIQHLLKS